MSVHMEIIEDRENQQATMNFYRLTTDKLGPVSRTTFPPRAHRDSA